MDRPCLTAVSVQFDSGELCRRCCSRAALSWHNSTSSPPRRALDESFETTGRRSHTLHTSHHHNRFKRMICDQLHALPLSRGCVETLPLTDLYWAHCFVFSGCPFFHETVNHVCVKKGGREQNNTNAEAEFFEHICERVGCVIARA